MHSASFPIAVVFCVSSDLNTQWLIVLLKKYFTNAIFERPRMLSSSLIFETFQICFKLKILAFETA